MQIQVNSDNHVQGSQELTKQVEEIVESALGRFGDWITRVEVQLSDENSGSKTGENDLRCVMEARAAGQKPFSVSHQANTVDQAVKGSAKKLTRMLDDTKSRLGDSKGNTSFAG